MIEKQKGQTLDTLAVSDQLILAVSGSLFLFFSVVASAATAVLGCLVSLGRAFRRTRYWKMAKSCRSRKNNPTAKLRI